MSWHHVETEANQVPSKPACGWVRFTCWTTSGEAVGTIQTSISENRIDIFWSILNGCISNELPGFQGIYFWLSIFDFRAKKAIACYSIVASYQCCQLIWVKLFTTNRKESLETLIWTVVVIHELCHYVLYGWICMHFQQPQNYWKKVKQKRF